MLKVEVQLEEVSGSCGNNGEVHGTGDIGERSWKLGGHRVGGVLHPQIRALEGGEMALKKMDYGTLVKKQQMYAQMY